MVVKVKDITKFGAGGNLKIKDFIKEKSLLGIEMEEKKSHLEDLPYWRPKYTELSLEPGGKVKDAVRTGG